MHKKKEQTNIYSLFFVKVPKSRIQHFLMLNLGLTNNASISNLFPGYFAISPDQAASSIPKADNEPLRLY